MKKITTMADFSEDEREFADVIINIIEVRYKDDIQLANIPICLKDFENFANIMQEIATIQGKPYEKWEQLKGIVQGMLGSFDGMGQIKWCSGGKYKLRKEGYLYKHLAQTLGVTQ